MPERVVSGKAVNLAAAVAALIGPVYHSLEQLAAEVLARVEASGGELTERTLAPLEQAIAPRLAAHPSLAGMGYVAAPGVVGGQDRYLLWWQRSGGDLARLRLNLDPTSVDLYDYLQMEWFREPRDRHRRAAYGPWVDYSGSGLYVITGTVPVESQDRFLGVTGGDIVTAQLERRLIAILRTCPVEALVVGGERRVLAANTPRWVAGSRFPGSPVPGDDGIAAVSEVPGGPGWSVVVTDVPVGF